MDEQLATFCETEHAQLTGLLTLVTGDRHVAEELAQEALERACANWPRVRAMHNRRAWLRRVALSLAASRYRRRRAEWRANRRHGEPTARIEETAVSLAVREAVASLPPRQRTVIALRYFVGLDVAQTATVMSIDARPAELGSPRRALPDPGTTADTRPDTRSDTTSMISRLVTRPGRRATGVKRACARSTAVTIAEVVGDFFCDRRSTAALRRFRWTSTRPR